MGGYRDGDVPIIVRGDGCYLEDAHGKRYLDALAGLFCVNVGYSYGEEMGQAALEQMRELPFYTNWSYAHPRAVELAAELAALAPGDLNRVLLRLGRLGGGRVRLEARAPVLPRTREQAHHQQRLRGDDAPRPALRHAAGAQVQGDRAADRLPRHDLRRPLDQRHPGDSHAVRAARPRGPPRPEHEPLPPPARGDGGGVHALPARGARVRRSRRWGPRPSASCTWSRCRTAAAASSRRRATGAACASSATATTSCSRPTR